MGASRGGAEPAGPFIFVWLMGEGSVNHEDPGLPSPFPASPQLGPRFCPGRLWRLRSPLHSLTPPLLPACARISGRTSSPADPKAPTWVNGPVILGLLREPDAPGPGSAESAKPQASLVLLCPPAIRAARPGPGRTCICRSTDFFWPRGLRRGFGSRAQRKQGLWRRRAVRGYQSWSGERRGDE